MLELLRHASLTSVFHGGIAVQMTLLPVGHLVLQHRLILYGVKYAKKKK